MEWEKSEDEICPRCNEPTFYLIDGEYNRAEGCKRCGWVADFTADKIKVRQVGDIEKFIPSMESDNEEG